MNTKNLVLMALLVGVGAALYVITPGMVQGMKPDFMLTMMFIGILLFPTFKETFLLAIATGVLSGLFTTFPAGFIPNVIDKASSCSVILYSVYCVYSVFFAEWPLSEGGVLPRLLHQLAESSTN